MRGRYSRSIFADALNHIIAPYDLTDLSRSPVSLDPRKVKALVDSLTSLRRLPGLNPGEIMTIVIKLKLADDQRLQIYAALIALGVQRLLLEYLSDERAWLVAEEVREAALVWLRRQRGGDVFRRIPRLGLTQEDEPLETIDPLQEALDTYDQGVALSTIGQFTGGEDENQPLLPQARLHFEHAKSVLDLLPPTVRETEDWHYWHEEVEKELEELE